MALGRAAYIAINAALKFLQALGVKTFDYFGTVIARMVRSLYSRAMDELEFVQVFEDLLYGQFRQAWLEGMERNGLSESDMTVEYETELGAIIDRESGEVLGFADAIVEQEGADHLSGENHLDALMSRGELWQMRYIDVTNQAVLFTAKKGQNLVWVFGNTEHHCETCAALNEVVASAEDWLASGLHPQQPPNDRLECEGWKCDCRLEPTDAEPTPGGIPNV